jgi:hypothetical protein
MKKWVKYVLVILSLNYVIQKKEMKVRMYDDDYETSVVDFNNAIDRKRKNTAIFI